MPKLYWETAHEETHLLIHAIEYKSQQGSNYDLSNFFFNFKIRRQVEFL